MKKWFVFASLFVLSVTIPAAQAGLLGAMIGAAVAHHDEQQQNRDGRLAGSPAKRMVTGAVEGAVAEGAAVGAGRFVLDHKIAAVGVTAIALGVGDMSMRDDLYAGHCVKNGFEWSCPGIPGQHVIVVEWKDYIRFANTEKLRDNMKAAGETIPPPKSGCAAHHIVPAGLSFSPLFEDSRNILEECDIDIDSAENGVFLPYVRHPSSFCAGRTYHRDLHTARYADTLYFKLKSAMQKNGCDGVHKVLQEIKQELKDGVSWR